MGGHGTVAWNGVMAAGDDDWVSVSEAARRLGVSRSAIRNRIKRGTLKTQSDNHGHPMVLVHGTVPGTVRGGPYRKVPSGTVPGQDLIAIPPEPPARPTEGPATVPLEWHTEAMNRLQGALNQAHSEALAALQQAHQSTLERHQRHIEHLIRQHRESQAMLVERVDRAEVLIDKLLDRPWWRRIFGR